MPRNPQGLYTLPAGNPVVPNTLIETSWANPTMEDIASALTGSLPRDGSAPMTGQLTLAAAAPTLPRHAVSKGYVEQFLAYATGMPVGAVTPLAGTIIPAGYLLCDGQAVPRADYPALFAAIGTTYGAGDSVSTFNVPDLRDWFIRGRSSDRPIGSQQAAAFASHNHPMQDPGHLHSISDPGHAHTAQQPSHVHGASQDAHSHGVSDPGHSHTSNAENVTAGSQWGAGGESHAMPATINAALTGISIQAAQPAVYVGAAQPGVTVNAALSGVSTVANVTGASIGVAGGTETRPQNVAMNYVIKAVNDSSQVVALTGITSSDDNMIAIDTTNPVVPELLIHSNVAFGIPKLDASGKVPLSLLPTGSQQLLGYWDASGGQTPSQASPSTDYNSGDTYIISVTGLLTVYDPVTLTANPTTVAVGSLLQYIENSLTNPTGWYYVVSSATVVASQVGFTPVGTIAATNVQAAIAEVDGDVVANTGAITALNNALTILDGEVVKHSSATGAAFIPVGNTAQRDTTQLGAMRFNSQLNLWEGLDSTGWTTVGGGISQGQADARYLQLTGGTLSGNLTAIANYVSTSQAMAANALTRKDYVDGQVSTKVSKSGDTMSGVLTSTVSNNPAFQITTPSHPSGRKGGFFGSYSDTSALILGSFADDGVSVRRALRFDADTVGFDSALSDAYLGAGQTPLFQVTTKPTFPAVNHFINGKAQAFWSFLDPAGGSSAGGIGFAVTFGDGQFSAWTLQSDRVSGNLTITGQLIPGASDERLKENKVRIAEPLAKLSQLSGYEFDWKETGPQKERGHDTGLIAQEVQTVFPQCVTLAGFDSGEDGKTKSGNSYLTIKSGNQITALLVEAVKELSAKLDAAVAEIAALKAAK